MLYPLYSYAYHTFDAENPLLRQLCLVVRRNRGKIQDIRNTPYRRSIDVEKALQEDLQELGFIHSVTNKKVDNIFRANVNFEVDFYHPMLQVALEIEKGEINNVWKNVIKFSESNIIQHGVLLVPIIRHEGSRNQSEFYNNTMKKLGNMERIYSLISTLVIIGY